MNQVGGNPCAYGNFAKFGSGVTLHHIKPMPTNTLFVVVSSRLIVNVYLPFPNLGHDIPLRTIGDVIRYIILWPYKLTSLNYM
jgi:hypothetical protein